MTLSIILHYRIGRAGDEKAHPGPEQDLKIEITQINRLR